MIRLKKKDGKYFWNPLYNKDLNKTPRIPSFIFLWYANVASYNRKKKHVLLASMEGKKIFQQAWKRKAIIPGLQCCFDFNIARRDRGERRISRTRFAFANRRICILLRNCGSFRCLGFTLFLSFRPCATSHFINMKVPWRRWNDKTDPT